MVLLLIIPFFFVLEFKNIKTNWKNLLALSVFSLLAFIINMKAPGTSIKTIQYANVNTEDVKGSFLAAFENFRFFFTSGRFFTLVAFGVLVYGIRVLLNLKKFEKTFSIFILGLICFNHFIFSFLHNFKLGYNIVYRVENLLNAFDFVLVMFFAASLKAFEVKKKMTIIVSVIIGVSAIFPFLQVSNLGLLIGDAKNGRMSYFKSQMDDRIKLIESKPDRIIYVPELKNIPISIFYEPLPSDSVSGNSFYCEQLADYYQKDWIFSK